MYSFLLGYSHLLFIQFYKFLHCLFEDPILHKRFRTTSYNLHFSIADINSGSSSCCHQLAPSVSVSAVLNDLLETAQTATASIFQVINIWDWWSSFSPFAFYFSLESCSHKICVLASVCISYISEPSFVYFFEKLPLYGQLF